MHSIKDLHIFELFKRLTQILRSECEINSLNFLITKKEIESVELKITSARQLKSSNAVSRLSPKRLGVRIRKLLNFKLKFNPNFISEVQILSKKELKRYQYSSRDNYISNNQQIVSYYIELVISNPLHLKHLTICLLKFLSNATGITWRGPSDFLMTYQVSGRFLRPSLYSKANLPENNLLLLLIVWITDATEEAELYTLKQFYFWLVWTPPAFLPSAVDFSMFMQSTIKVNPSFDFVPGLFVRW